MSWAEANRLERVLQEVWGYPAFRPLQLPIAESVLSQRDTVALLPTGGGKSLCFQVPGIVLGGTTVVISPLISLMSDQVAQLKQRGIDARSLAGDLSAADWMDLQRRPPQFAYVSPERAQSRNFLAILEHWDVRLLAIDEAHCVSQWGHDFRPQYRELFALREFLKGVPCIALTASATPEVLKDLVKLLGLRDPNIFQASFARPNLIWTVREVADVAQACVSSIRPMDGRQIVYVRSRDGAVRWAEELKRNGIPAAAYHAGIAPEERARLQDSWSAGGIRTMVATTAFGMGIDQANVRQVIHAELPESPESLYQEIGRGGRDGKDAQALILLNSKSLGQFRRKMERTMPTYEQWLAQYHELASRSQIAVGDGVGVRINPQTPAEERILGIMVRKGLAELLEGTKTSAKIQLRSGGEELVDMAEANPKYSELLYALARRFPGIVTQSERVELSALASMGGWTLAQVRKLLNEASGRNLLHFEAPGSGIAYRWMHPRYPPPTSPILKSDWEVDRNRILHRARAVAAMLDPNALTCRFGQLLEYFGESPSDCERCDVCESKKSPSDAAEALLIMLRESPGQRISVTKAFENLGVPRKTYIALLGRGATLGWWSIDADGWIEA
jgi:ATP-dependent DNA helicase RecQ